MTFLLNLSATPVGNVIAQPASGLVTEPVSVVPNLSAFNMFMHAELTAQIVMLLLIAASIWSWAIAFEKHFLFRDMKKKMLQFEKDFWSGAPLEQMFLKKRGREDNPLAIVFSSAFEEWRTNHGKTNQSIDGYELRLSARDRVNKAMNLAINRVNLMIEKNISYLATIGSTSPFIGLFGTVWGIMSSFQSIAASKNTTLAVVAPGIAEALLATALGLAAAIPAVIFYNKFISETEAINHKVTDFATELSTIISREMEK
jgi:biopolymer transport protein TolQ